MPVRFDHTIVKVSDRQRSAAFYTEVLALAPATANGPFLEVRTASGGQPRPADTEGRTVPAHYAFLVSGAELDAIHACLRRRGLPYWADPFNKQPDAIDTEDGGRGPYWDDPDGHLLEIRTA